MRTTDAGATGIAVSPSSQKITAVAFSSASTRLPWAPMARPWSPARRSYLVTGGRSGSSAPASGDCARRRQTLANSGGANGVLARTLDGGATWTTVGVPTNGAVLDASFPNPDVGFAIDSGAGAFKTAGKLADPRPGLDRSGGRAALDPNTVLLIGPRGVRRSTDGGNSFAFIADEGCSQRPTVNAEPAGTAVLAYGPEALRLSTNGGQSWKPVRLPQRKVKIRDADFVSARVGFALTNKGACGGPRTPGAGGRS